MQARKIKEDNVISIAEIDDTDEIMKFIGNEWEKGHILGNNKDFFLYEYRNNDHLNFVVSKNQHNKINGILGFLKASSEKDSTVWTTMWKVSKDNGTPMLGVNLLNFLREQGYLSVMSSGINLKTEEIYRYLGFHVGTLKHYFIPNQELRGHKIAVITDSVLKKNIAFNKNEYFFLKKIGFQELEENFNFDKYRSRIPYKDSAYFNRRFFQHPIYNYDVYGAFHNSHLLGIIAVRIVAHENSTCMRIVDFYGEEDILNSIIGYLTDIMYLQRHEYIDLFCEGLSEQIILDAGFFKINESKNDLVVPNYFEPFSQANIGIRYFTDTQDLEKLRIFKADGDQDRPRV